jgi:hypothetical protein
VLAAGGVLDLEEGLEHLGGLVGRDADAGVADREGEPGRAPAPAGAAATPAVTEPSSVNLMALPMMLRGAG